MTRRRAGILIVMVIVVAAGGAGAYYRYWRMPAPSDHLTLYGNIDIREVNLAFNVDGRIKRMLAEEGDGVNEGQLLAVLDDSRYQDATAAARAAVASQKAIVARLATGSRPEEIAQARANVEAAEGSWRAARATLERQRKLALDRYTSQQALDEAQAAMREAQGRLDALKQELALAVAGPRAEDIAEAEAHLSAAEADLSLALNKLDDTRLLAASAGTVLTRIQEPGAVILGNTPVYTLALTDPVWVRTYVSEPDLGHVVPGMRAEIITDSAPDMIYEGWVGFISPTAEFTPKAVQTTEIRTSLVYRVRVFVQNADHGLRQGMPVTVRLPLNAGSAAGQDRSKVEPAESSGD